MAHPTRSLAGESSVAAAARNSNFGTFTAHVHCETAAISSNLQPFRQLSAQKCTAWRQRFLRLFQLRDHHQLRLCRCFCRPSPSLTKQQPLKLFPQAMNKLIRCRCTADAGWAHGRNATKRRAEQLARSSATAGRQFTTTSVRYAMLLSSSPMHHSAQKSAGATLQAALPSWATLTGLCN